MGILSEIDMMNRDAEDDAFEVSSDSETVDSFSEEFEPVETQKQEPQAEDAEEARKKALEEKEFTATAGGGAVEVTISGKREVTKVKLDEEVVDPDDIEMLEDLIVAATNEALRKVEEESAAVMSKLTGGLGGLGGGLPF